MKTIRIHPVVETGQPTPLKGTKIVSQVQDCGIIIEDVKTGQVCKVFASRKSTHDWLMSEGYEYVLGSDGLWNRHRWMPGL